MKRKYLRPIIIAVLILSAVLLSCNLNVGDRINTHSNSRSIENYRFGVIEESQDNINQIPKYSSKGLATNHPPQVDYSCYLPPVGSQGSQNSCTAWAVGYYLKTLQENIEWKWDINSVYNEFSPAWLYNQINSGSDNGSKISDAMNLLVSNGCDSLKYFPYDQNDYSKWPDGNSTIRASKYKSKSWRYLALDVNTIKAELISNKALIMSCKVYSDFISLSESNPVYDNISGSYYGLHALCIVGYDDSKNAFKVVNSWGTQWGINGYGYISYSFFGLSNPANIYVYELFDMTHNISYRSVSLADHRLASINYFWDGILRDDAYPDAPWILENRSVISTKVSGNRIGVLIDNGDFYVKEGDARSIWILEAHSISQFEITDTRIGVIDSNENFYIKEGDLHTGWTLVDVGVSMIKLTDNRIGSMKTDGRFFIKEGDLHGGWVLENTEVISIAISENRIGVITNNFNCYVKEGDIHGGWILENDNVLDVQLTDNLIGVIKSNGYFYLKEGAVNSGWILEAYKAVQISLFGDKIGVVTNEDGNNLFLKTGNMRGDWEQVKPIVL